MHQNKPFWLFQDLRNIHSCIWALWATFDFWLYSTRKGYNKLTQRNYSLAFDQLTCPGEWTWLHVLPRTRLLKSLLIGKSMSYHVLKSHTMVLFTDQMHHWDTYLGKYKERSSAQNTHRAGIVSTSDQLTMTSVMPWWEGGGKPLTQMLQILPDGDIKGERLHYLQLRLYSFKKSLEWKRTRHLAAKRVSFTITHWPWLVRCNFNGKTVSKSALTLDLPFPYFSEETQEGACLSACRGY